MAVYVILVTVIFRRSTPDFPLFVFAALLPWKWFTTSVSDAITAVSGQDKLIKQIMFPKIVLPLGILLSGVAQFMFGLIPLIGMLVLFYPGRIHLTLLWIPVVAVVQVAFTLAIGLIASAVNVFFRDIGNLSRHLLRLWFYLSPVLYGQDTVTGLAANHKYIGGAMELNPFYPILNGYRNAIYEGVAPDLASLGFVLLGSVVVLAVAVIFFKRVEPAFAKIL
jgi:ABC-type polysaccharide/polyol phosphate export permease